VSRDSPLIARYPKKGNKEIARAESKKRKEIKEEKFA
jgi:hypothetical protein